MESSSKTALIIGVVLLLIIGGGAAYVLTRDNSDPEPQVVEQVETQDDELVEEQQDIVSLAIATEDLSTLVAAVQAAELVETLQGEGPFTVLAPTNAAFDALPAGTLDSLLEPANQEQLQGILTYHVISGAVFSSDLTDGQEVTTVNGATLTVEITDEGVFFVDANGGKAHVSTPDVAASNGVVHIINAVLLP
jgi:uncharacterized surface protein with fasciclin (FAS1) repeats